MNSQIKGSLIVIDGPSGSGKDSLINALTSKLRNFGIDVFLFSEEQLDQNRAEILEARNVGKKLGGTGDRQMTEVLLAHRHSLYETYVIPNIQSDNTVIANRGEPTTEAYQSATGEPTMEEIWEMHRVSDIPIPDLVIITSCTPDTAVRRMESDMNIASSIRKEQETGRGLSGKITVEQNASHEEKLEKQRRITGQYDLLAEFLEKKGVNIIRLNTEQLSIDEETQIVLSRLRLDKPQ